MAPVKLQTSTTPAMRVCVGCDMLTTPAAPGAPLCGICAEDLARARERIERRRATAEGIATAAQQRLFAAIAALPEADRARWRSLDRARRQAADGTADEVTARRVTVTMKALKANDPRMGAGLCGTYVAEEAWWWTGEECAAHERRAQQQIAALDAWLNAKEVAA